MYGGGVRIYKLERLCNVVQSPLGRLFGQTPSLDVPAERSEPFCGDVYVALSLHRVQNLDYPWMAQGSQLAKRIASERQAGLVCGDVEGEDAAFGAIVLAARCQQQFACVCLQIPGPYSLCAVVQSPDGVVQVDTIAKRVAKCRALGYGRGDGRLEKVHGCSVSPVAHSQAPQ